MCLMSDLSTNGQLEIGKQSSYFYLDAQNNLKLGRAGTSNIPGAASLSEVKKKIEAYIKQCPLLVDFQHRKLVANIDKINAKIEKHNANLKSTVFGAFLSFFGIGIIDKIRKPKRDNVLISAK